MLKAGILTGAGARRARLAERAFCCLVVLLALHVVGACARPRAPLPVAQGIPVPQISKGEAWKYRSGYQYTYELDFMITVVDVTADVISVKAEDTRKMHHGQVFAFTREWNEGRSAALAPRYVAFPLKAGATWRQYVQTNSQGRYGKSLIKGRVLGRERVTVPAGTFDAYKIVVTREESEDGPGNAAIQTATITTWYVPEVKRHVRRDTSNWRNGRERDHRIEELMEYSTVEHPSLKPIELPRPEARLNAATMP